MDINRPTDLQLRALAAFICFRIVQQMERRSRGNRITFGYSGEEWVQSMLHGPERRFQSAARMEKTVFTQLINEIRNKSMLRDRPLLSVEGQVLMFLCLASLGVFNREIRERFQVSGWTVGSVLNSVCNCLATLSTEWIKLPPPNLQSTKITADPAYYPFKDAIGALDGTHIPVHCSPQQHDLYGNRKNTLTQNVLACVDFDLNFVFVLAGWEGKAHDAAVLEDALSVRGFTVPPDCYYLGDGGYANRWPMVTPFRKVRYHLKEWASGNDRPQNKEELFNLRHAKLRNAVERVFGIIKRRFSALSNGIQYPLPFQIKFVYAICGLHNFINACRTNSDAIYQSACLQFLSSGFAQQDNVNGDTREPDSQLDFSATTRRTVSDSLWQQYQMIMSNCSTIN